LKHTIIIEKLPEGFVPAPDMLPFTAVRHEKMSLPENGILSVRTVGVRCLGYFRPLKAEPVKAADVPDSAALDALNYGLMTAQFRLSGTPDDLAELFTTRQAELTAEANAALEQSESPVRLDEVVFAYADYCVHDGSYGTSAQRYSGFVIGQKSTRQITAHKPKGIPGEWQCVCGAFSAPGECCEECGIRRPVL